MSAGWGVLCPWPAKETEARGGGKLLKVSQATQAEKPQPEVMRRMVMVIVMVQT